MAFLKKHLWLFFIVFVSPAAQACPACLVADRSPLQRILLLGIMGFLPVVVAVAVGFKIYRVCRSNPQEATKGPIK